MSDDALRGSFDGRQAADPNVQYVGSFAPLSWGPAGGARYDNGPMAARRVHFVHHYSTKATWAGFVAGLVVGLLLGLLTGAITI